MTGPDWTLDALTDVARIIDELAKAGVEVLDDDPVRQEFMTRDPATVAYLLVTPDGGRVVTYLNPDVRLAGRGLPAADLAAGILGRFERFAEHGPQPDGWDVSQHGQGHYLYLRLRHLPAV